MQFCFSNHTMPCSKSSQSLTKIVIMIKMFPTTKEILAVQKFLKRFSKITISAESKFELSQYLKDFPCQQLGALSTRTELKGYISEMQRKARNKNHSKFNLLAGFCIQCGQFSLWLLNIEMSY